MFSAQTVEVFEYNKVAILTITALALLGGAAAAALGRWVRGDPAPAPLDDRVRAILREPIAAGMVLFLTSAACSTLVSISVRTSVYGAHESFAGIFTMTAYAVLFFATRQTPTTGATIPVDGGLPDATPR